MPTRLSTADADFEERFAVLLDAKRESSEDVGRVVAEIIASVRSGGDRTLAAYTERFDRHAATPDRLHIGAEEIAAARMQCRPGQLEALSFARDRIEAYHRAQRPEDARFTDATGAVLGWRWTAIEAAGLMCRAARRAIPPRC